VRPISVEKRELIVAAKERGEKDGEIAVWLGMSASSVSVVWRLHRASGSVLPKKYRGRPPRLTAEGEGRVAAEVSRTPDATLAELIERLSLPVKKSQLHRLLAKLGFQRKKRRYVPKAGPAKTSAGRGRRGPRPRKA
jgi:transposase